MEVPDLFNNHVNLCIIIKVSHKIFRHNFTLQCHFDFKDSTKMRKNLKLILRITYPADNLLNLNM